MGHHAAAPGSSVSCTKRAPARNVRAAAFDVIGEDRRAKHKDQISTVQAGDDRGTIGGQEAGEQRMALGKAVACRHRAYPHGGLMLLGERNGLIPGIVARHRRADHDDGSASGA